jgi:ATP-dependent DNA helicase RecG
VTIAFGPDSVADEVARALTLLQSGTWDNDETARVELKEEAGRRDRQGRLLPGEARNQEAAKQVAGESACLANTPGSGALILGAADDGTLIGTNLDIEWLRHRAYELTNRQLTVDARAVEVNGVRLLVITAPEAIEPIRWRDKIRWRVGDHCVEIDPATWHSKRMLRQRFDWSAQPSLVESTQAREASVDVARRFLRDSAEAHATELARQPTPELLRRLNVVTGDGYLTNAGVLAFVGRNEACLDYVRRDLHGGDSRQRVNQGGRGLLEELQETLTNVAATNTVHHLRRGAAAGQIRDIPEQAVREAIVNGLAHREWGLAQPTVVEHVGNTLRVTSPGGFFGGVNSRNIITHPSESRNRALAELFAAIRAAEREGVGVDRMVREMLRLGHEAPEINEIEGPYVRTALVGDAADAAWINWLDSIEPDDTSDDVNALLLLRHLVDEGWIDVIRATPLLQLDRRETQGALGRLSNTVISGGPVLAQIPGVPDDQEPGWSLTAHAREALQDWDRRLGKVRTWPTRDKIARTYSRDRGRISTTELGAIVGAHATNVGNVLKHLEAAGYLRPSRPNRRGPGFFYVRTDGDRGE